VGVEVGVANLIDDIFACSIDGVGDFSLDEIEVVVDGLLK
jgi:hypothetical protein